MKKNIRMALSIGLLFCGILSLSSCDFSYIHGIVSDIKSDVNNNNFGKISEDFKTIEYDSDENDSGNEIRFKDVYKSQGYVNLNSIGEQKILVIPCYFSDLNLSTLKYDQDQVRENIYNTFFGTKESTNYWHSVSSFYDESSYGNLKITGKVTEFFEIGKTVNEVGAMKTDTFEPTYYVLRNAIDWYKKNYDDIADYDTDNDGYVDAIWLVYANSYYSSTSSSATMQKYLNDEAKSMLWAYTYWDYRQKPQLGNPVANCYAWASSYFMYDGVDAKNKVDAHTFIHETGHMMGLEDYYDYDSSSDHLSPTGGLDMMDCNIGDHNAYSKYLLGWKTPTLVNKEGEYTLKPFQKDGSSLLIPASLDKFSYSPFDEYLLIDFYTPTDLNDLDSKNNYRGYYPKLFSKYGVRIYHVDSRLTLVNKRFNKLTYTNYYEDSKITNESYYVIPASNTQSESISESIKLIRLLSATGTNNNFYGSSSSRDATNADLFLNKDTFYSFTFNNGNNLEYKISISLNGTLISNPTEAKINITSK